MSELNDGVLLRRFPGHKVKRGKVRAAASDLLQRLPTARDGVRARHG